MSKLTKRSVDALAAPGKGQAFKWDGELRGFGVRVTASGLKSFILQYRNSEGRSRRIVIGRYGILTVEQAREKAKIQLGSIADGKDPASEKNGRKQAMKVEAIGCYIAKYFEPRGAAGHNFQQSRRGCAKNCGEEKGATAKCGRNRKTRRSHSIWKAAR